MISLDSISHALPKFALGDVVLTSGALGKLKQTDVKIAIARHGNGDWGELEPAERRENDERVEKGGALAPIYRDTKGVRFYVLTESDRSTTTVLVPEEY